MIKLTESQFKEQYGHVKVVFSSYFKYSFSFKGELEDEQIYVSIGGNSGDIYRVSISANQEYEIKELNIVDATVMKNSIIIAEFSDY